MDLKREFEMLNERYFDEALIEKSVQLAQKYAEHYQALQLTQPNVSGSNYLVKYKKKIESGHPLLNDEIITVTEIVKVFDVMEINSLFKNIVDVKQIF
jgi:hypothetical protein